MIPIRARLAALAFLAVAALAVTLFGLMPDAGAVAGTGRQRTPLVRYEPHFEHCAPAAPTGRPGHSPLNTRDWRFGGPPIAVEGDE